MSCDQNSSRPRFDQAHLRRLGFVGFVALTAEQADLRQVPSLAGIYAVLLPGATRDFLASSAGGRFKGKDPTVSLDALESKWCDGVDTLYIGRAGNLRSRVAQLRRFGQGEPVGHWGGRYLWQLSARERLLIAWCPEADPIEAETELIDDFENTIGRLPFANLVRGTRAPAHV